MLTIYSAEVRRLHIDVIHILLLVRERFLGLGGISGECHPANEICHLAYTLAWTGTIPADEPPSVFNFNLMTGPPSGDIHARFWPTDDAPVDECPHCFGNRISASTIIKAATQPEPSPDVEPMPTDDLIDGYFSEHSACLSGRLTPERTPVIVAVEVVLIQQGNSFWARERARLDPGFYVGNRHGARGRELPYGGLISESCIESLVLSETVESFERAFLFAYGDKHRAVRGIGTVDIEWKWQPDDDDWGALVVETQK